MYIIVKLYSHLKKYASEGKTQFKLELPAGACLEDVLMNLNIPWDDTNVLLINGKRADKASVFQDGDTLVMFPEISGG